MAVYPAYGLLVLHVALGELQAEGGTVPDALVLGSAALVFGLHVAAGLREWRRDETVDASAEGWVDVGDPAAIPEGRAIGAVIGGERVAVFRHEGRLSAVSGVCRHQNGPLAEGRVIDGCITCPWHGYQYRPEDGRSPPPYDDKIETFNLRVRNGRVEIHQRPNPPGTRVEPVAIGAVGAA
jgi:nitrite reductase/ring-hydroxylating ferredoxin subunit